MSEQEEKQHNGPTFSEAREGANVQIPPPFDFQGVNAKVFPLRANMGRLVHFCNQFINKGIPEEIVFFRPAIPVVFLQIIYYGRMAVETQNFGWFSQHEFVFSVPVERYRMTKAGPVFEDWGLINPFIFVNKESSELLGREVYGWPKIHGWMDSNINPWVENSRADRQLVAMNTMVYDKPFAGEKLHGHKLIEVYERAPSTWSEIPPDTKNGLNPLSIMPRAASDFMEVLQMSWANLANMSTGTAMTWIDNIPVKGYRPIRNSVEDVRKIVKTIPKLLPINENNSYPLITLKQFRDAEDPRFACYQALISSNMYLKQFNKGGLLGDERMLQMDTSGGYYIKIHEFPNQPIAQSLGLVPFHTEVGEHEVKVSSFEPVLPFWMDVDLAYNKGEIVCSQTRWSKWERGKNPVHEPAVELPIKSRPLEQPLSVNDLNDPHLYNTARGEANAEMTGPFYFPNATIRVLPLLADKEVLQEFIANSMNHAEQKFEVAGDKVYMMVINYDQMASATNNIGRWAHREVRFAVPVRWYNKKEFVSMGLVSPFIYCDRDTMMTTMREVYGEPAFKSSIQAPRSPWIETDGPVIGPHVMELSTDVLPSLFTGSQMVRRKLISVEYDDPISEFDYDGWNRIAADWAPELLKDLNSKQDRKTKHPKALKHGKALALELLANEIPVNQFSFKQFRDVNNLEEACYQALVKSETTIEHIWDIEEIEQKMHVRINEYPTQPIVRLLGLKAKWHATDDEPHGAVLQPLRPFWMKVALKTGVAQNIAERAGTDEWRKGSGWPSPENPGYFMHEDREDEDQLCAVGTGIVDALDEVTAEARDVLDVPITEDAGDMLGTKFQFVGAAPQQPDHDIWSYFFEDGNRKRNQYLKLALQDWQNKKDSERLTRKQAAKALSSDERVDPQMIIDSILTHEWAHWGNPRFYRNIAMKDKWVNQLPEFCIRRDSVGIAAAAVFPKEQCMEPSTGGWYPKRTNDDETNNSQETNDIDDN